MPDPKDGAVRISAVAETAAEPRENKQTPGILGYATAEDKPEDIEFNVANYVGSVSQVATEYGEGSDIHNAAKAARSTGCHRFVVVLAELTEETETLAGTDDTPSTSGQGSAPPATGFGDGVTASGAPATLSVDGGEPIELDATTATPAGSDVETVEAGTGLINMDTVEVESGDETAGDGTGGLELTYNTLSYSRALEALAGASVDVLTVAGERYDRSNIGDIDELSTWGDGEDVFIQYPFVRGTTLAGGNGPASRMAELDLVQDVGTYSPSRLANPIVNSSPDDVGAFYLGWFAVREFWANPTYQIVGLNANDNGRYAGSGVVGPVESPGTFEGGRDGTGPANVLLSDGGSQLSNTLSWAGVSSPYRYSDIARSEAFAKVKARNATVEALRKLPRFNKNGHDLLEGAITIAMDAIVARRDTPFVDIEVDVAEALELSENTRLNRVWEQIQITLYFAPPAHRADIKLTTELWNGQTSVDVDQAAGSTVGSVTA